MSSQQPDATATSAGNMSKESLMQAYDSTPQEERVNMLKSLPTEQKAIVLATLKERLSQAQQQQQPASAAPAPAPQYPPPKLGYAYVSGGRDDGADDYDDMEPLDDEDAFEADMQRFEDEFGLVDDEASLGSSSTPSGNQQHQRNAFGGGIDLTMLAGGGSGGGVDRVLATDPYARRKEVGDFELLRLAKMGDVVSFKEFEGHQPTGVATFFDNNQRDALHYAVDGGSLELVKYLVEAKRMPFRSDEKLKATALDIAVLLDRTEVLAYLKTKYPGDAKSFEEALRTFAPPPPRFCISKAVPIAVPPQRTRVFWGVPAPTTAAPQEPAAAEDPIVCEIDGVAYSAEQLDGQDGPVFDTVLAIINRANTGEHTGLDAWTMPMEAGLLGCYLRSPLSTTRAIVAGVTAIHGDQVSPAAIGLAMGLGATLLLPAGAAGGRVVLFGGLSVVPIHQKKGVNALLMRVLRRAIVAVNNNNNNGSNGGGSGGVVGLFACKERLPVQPLAFVKWYRRSLRPMRVFSQWLASSEIYPDFYNYDDRLRVDTVAKETLAEASTPTLHKWVQVDAETSEKASGIIASSLPGLLKKAGAEVSIGFDSGAAVQETIACSGLKAYFIPSADGTAITDFVCLRVRESREREEGNGGAAALRCAVHVFSVFSSISGEKRLLEILVIAKLLDCDVLYSPNTCGMTDSDFSKSMFEETEGYREYLYAVRGDHGAPQSIVAGKAMTPGAKVFVPIGLL